MPKTYVAKNIAAVNNINFVADAAGNLSAIKVSCEVNYGTFGQSEVVDMLPLLTATQAIRAKEFYQAIKAKLENIYLT